MNIANQLADVCQTAYQWLRDSYLFLLDAHHDGEMYPIVLLGLACFAVFCWWKGCTPRIRSAFDAIRDTESKIVKYGGSMVCAATWLDVCLVEKYPPGAGLIGLAMIMYIGLLSRWWRIKLDVARRIVLSVVKQMTFFRHILSGRHYCTQCHSEIGSDIDVRPMMDVFRLESWCSSCRESVQVTSCKVPLWTAVVTGAIGFLPDLV